MYDENTNEALDALIDAFINGPTVPNGALERDDRAHALYCGVMARLQVFASTCLNMPPPTDYGKIASHRLLKHDAMLTKRLEDRFPCCQEAFDFLKQSNADSH